MSTPPLGVPGERTALSWSRTSLSMTIVGVLVARVGDVDHDAVLAAGGVVLILGALFAWSTGRARVPLPGVSGPHQLRRVRNLVVAGSTALGALLTLISGVIGLF